MLSSLLQLSCLHLVFATQSVHQSLIRSIDSIQDLPENVVEKDGEVKVDIHDTKTSIPASLVKDEESPKIVYGVITNNGKGGQEKLRGQMETWAADAIKQSRFFAVTGSQYGNAEKSMPDVLSEAACADDKGAIDCKEVHTLEVGFSRKADWLVRVDDDSYVDTKAFESELAALGSKALETPMVAAAVLGCGTSKDEEKTNISVHKYCPHVAAKGGLCGGGGYAINRAALTMLHAAGWPTLLGEYQAYKRVGFIFSDLVTSCALAHRGVEFHPIYGGTGALLPTHKRPSWQYYLGQRPLTYHSATPGIMHWLHAELQGKPQHEVNEFVLKAFEKGCCCFDYLPHAQAEAKRKTCLNGTMEEHPKMYGQFHEHDEKNLMLAWAESLLSLVP